MATRWKLLFCAVAASVQTALLIKCPLFIVRQISPRVFLYHICPDTNISEETVGQDYLFTMVVYCSLFIGRWAEALIIHIHVYKFFFKQSTSTLQPREFKQLCQEGLTKCYKKLSLSFIMFIQSSLMPILGIILEIRHGHKANCEGYVYEHHTVYWILDFFIQLHDSVIRLLMFLATIATGRIWSKLIVTKIETGSNEPRNYKEYQEDRNITSRDYRFRIEEYAQRGSEVKCLLDIFQAWFIVPWLLYFIGSSLDTDYILRSFPGRMNQLLMLNMAFLEFIT